MSRKPAIAIIGGSEQTSTHETREMAFKTGKILVDMGCRILSGGLGGVMEAVSKGAKTSENYQEGDIIGIIPSLDPNDANDYCDIVIATGMGYARNQIIVASADVVIAIGGGSGTLSEIAFAWQMKKTILAYKIEGWSGKLAGKVLDQKRTESIFAIESPNQLPNILSNILGKKLERK